LSVPVRMNDFNMCDSGNMMKPPHLRRHAN
jgi:hypothetical protein